MKSLAAFLVGLAFGLAGAAVIFGASWGEWVFIGAFIAGVTFLNLHDDEIFGRRIRRRKEEQERWAREQVARELVEFEGDYGPLPWSGEEFESWSGRYVVGDEALSSSRWRWRRRQQTKKRKRWRYEYLHALAAEQKGPLAAQLQTEVRSVRNPNWLREDYEAATGQPSSDEGPAPTSGL